MIRTYGRKEVSEAVLIATLTALATSLINLGADTLHDWAVERRRARKQARKESKR